MEFVDQLNENKQQQVEAFYVKFIWSLILSFSVLLLCMPIKHPSKYYKTSGRSRMSHEESKYKSIGLHMHIWIISEPNNYVSLRSDGKWQRKPIAGLCHAVCRLEEHYSSKNKTIRANMGVRVIKNSFPYRFECPGLMQSARRAFTSCQYRSPVFAIASKHATAKHCTHDSCRHPEMYFIESSKRNHD